MRKAQEVGMHLNTSKCQFRKTEVKFFGKLLNEQGVVPDPIKIDMLKQLSKPRIEKWRKKFTFGREAKILTDHKPLIAISKNHLSMHHHGYRDSC